MITSSEPNAIRPVPRWLHVWAILTAVMTAVLLALGALVTTFRVGMADPVWPTTPWYLLFASYSEPRPGFLIEHAHRLAGFIVGGVAAVLALGLWSTAPRGRIRGLGRLGIIGLLATFGQFHAEMMKQVKDAEIVVPLVPVAGMFGCLLVVVICSLADLFARNRNAGLRGLGLVALVAVMIQGLLGGFRVRLNAWVGTDLAPVHGVFAQVVFALLVTLAVLTARRSTRESLPAEAASRCRKLALALVGFVFVQLIWGALVRHNPTPLAQRLHLLTAFLVVGTAMALSKTVSRSTGSAAGLRRTNALLWIVLVLQVTLGVEAWMGKFASGVLPELQKITPGQAIIRTAHVLVGTGILATSVTFVLLTFRFPVVSVQSSEPHSQNSAAVTPTPVALAGSHPLGGSS